MRILKNMRNVEEKYTEIKLNNAFIGEEALKAVISYGYINGFGFVLKCSTKKESK